MNLLESLDRKTFRSSWPDTGDSTPSTAVVKPAGRHQPIPSLLLQAAHEPRFTGRWWTDALAFRHDSARGDRAA